MNELKCITGCVLHNQREQSVTGKLTEILRVEDKDDNSITVVTFQVTVTLTFFKELQLDQKFD